MKLKIGFLVIFFGINVSCFGARKIDPADIKRTQEDSTLFDKSSCSSSDLKENKEKKEGKEEKEKKEDNETKVLIELQKIGSSEKTSGIMPIELSRIIMSYIKSYPSKLKEGFAKPILKNGRITTELNCVDKLYILSVSESSLPNDLMIANNFITIIDKKSGAIEIKPASSLEIKIGDTTVLMKCGRLLIYHKDIRKADITMDKAVELENGNLLIYAYVDELDDNNDKLELLGLWNGSKYVSLFNWWEGDFKSVLELIENDRLAILTTEGIFFFNNKNDMIFHEVDRGNIAHLLRLSKNEILTILDDGRLLIWDRFFVGHDEIRTKIFLKNKESVEHVLKTNNGTIITILSNGSVGVLNITKKDLDQKTYNIFNPENEIVTTMLELKDGKIAIATDEGSIIIFNPENGHYDKLEKVIDSSISHMYQLDNWDLLAISVDGNKILIFAPTIDITTNKITPETPKTNPKKGIAFSRCCIIQ